jgi:hypothetical protein
MSRKPAPSQKGFDQLLTSATTIRVWEYELPTYDVLRTATHGFPIDRWLAFEGSRQADFSSFREAFAISGGKPFCLCHGDVGVELLRKGGSPPAWLQVGEQTVHWNGWTADGLLADAPRAIDWLAARGVKTTAEYLPAARPEAWDDPELRRIWLEAIPAPLQAFGRRLMDESFAFKATEGELQAIDQSLENAYGSEQATVGSLLHWLGHSEESWYSFPPYEHLVIRLLLRHPTNGILFALQEVQATREQVEGAARLFSSFAFGYERCADRKTLPPSLMALMAEQVASSPVADHRKRFERAFAS